MATTVNNKKFTVSQLRSLKRRVESGKLSLRAVERDSFGITNHGGKTAKRVLDTVNV